MASLDLESKIIQQNGSMAIAGLDEAGRGALAGPVMAAAVVLPLDSVDSLSKLVEVNDSKQLTAMTRQRLSTIIMEEALAYGIGLATAEYVDQYGIIAATKQAMMAALGQLERQPDYLLIDGRIRLLRVALPQQSVVRGDSTSLSIAAASILAKVARDQMMVKLDARFPQYGFAQHKGYGTLQHRKALKQYGPTPEHRRTFAPLRASLF